MYDATQHHIILTDQSLISTSGEIICTLDNVEAVDRGLFAMKPSNGFVIKTKTADVRRWVPGLWWRIGGRIGVGGVTQPGEAKFLVEQMQALLSTGKPLSLD